MTSLRWNPSETPYPAARRDENHVERFKSAKRGEVEVSEPYIWLEDVRAPALTSLDNPHRATARRSRDEGLCQEAGRLY